MPKLSDTYPELVDAWHPYLNLPLKPNGYINARKQKIWWVCKKNPKHVFQSTLSSKAASKAGGCRYCSGKEVLKEDSLSKIHPDIASEWHLEKNNGQYPFKFSPGSNKKVWWKCPEGNDHEWSAVIYERTRKNRRNTCPFCADRKLSVTNSLAAKNPELAKQFNTQKNECKPEDVIASQKTNESRKMWWVCSENPNHEWVQFVAIRHKQGSGCPHCKNKWETATANTIEGILPRKAKTERQFRLGNFFFDIWINIEGDEYLIELDGQQHYEDKPHWGHRLKAQKERDREKTEIAKGNGFSFGRIPYWVKSRKEIQIELCNLLGREPTFPSVPRTEDKIIKKKPVRSDMGRFWLPLLKK